MKKVFKTFLAFIFVLCCFGFVGCGDKYGDLKISLSFSYNQTDTVTTLSDGTKRVRSAGYTFDEQLDGNYVFYLSQKDVSQNKFPQVTLKVAYSGYPGDFNFGTTVSSSNVEVASSATSGTSDSSDVYIKISLIGDGQSELTVLNNETNRTKKLYIDVQIVPNALTLSATNLAIANIVDNTSSINFLNYLSTNDTSNLTFQFGKLDEEKFIDGKITEENFTPYNLSTYGLTFDKSSCKLSLDRVTTLDSIDVVITYTNPVGDDLTTTLNVRFLKQVADFAVYKGNSFEDVKEENKVDSLDFYANFADDIFVDLVLTARSNGEKVKFDIAEDKLFPFSTNIAQTSVVYLNESKAETTSDLSTYAYQVVRIIATKNTEDTISYGEDRSYNLVLKCDYADYIVPTYPLYANIKTKSYDLVKAFKVNGSKVSHNSTEATNYNIYLNSSSSVYGEKFLVEVYDLPTILQENSKFKVEFYNSDLTSLSDVTSVLSVYYQEKNSTVVSPLTNDEIGNRYFDKETTFYVKPLDNSTLTTNDEIYMAFRAQKPAEKQAVAFCLLNVKEGLKEISSISYTYNKFKVNEETKEYIQDGNGNKETELKSETASFVKTAQLNVLECEKTINLDGDVANNRAEITLTCTPEGADLSNLSIVSSDPNLIEVTRDASNSKTFILSPRNVSSDGGEATITISASNLATVYKIKIKVYTAFNRFTVALVNPSSAFTTTENNSLINAKVEYSKKYSFSISTQPVLKKYQINYSLYKDNVAEDNLVGNLTAEYSDAKVTILEGKSSSLGDSNFSFDARDLGFSFTKNVSTQYVVVMSMINANGVVIKNSITLSSYVPLIKMELTNLKNNVYNANKIYYLNKVQSDTSLTLENLQKDDSVFGVKVETGGKNDVSPTYEFANCGYINIYVDDKLEAKYTLNNGFLNCTTQSNIISFLSDSAQDGYYIFRLNENYTNYGTGAIVVTVGVNQFEGVNASAFERSTRVSILPVGEVSSLAVNKREINFRQGQITPVSITVSPQGSNIKDNNVLTKVVGETTIDGGTYLYESEGMFSLQQTSASSTLKNYTLNIDSSFVGQGYVLFVPQDKLTTQEEYGQFFSIEYKPFSLTKAQFVSGMFYTLDDQGQYVVATEYVGTNYYLKTISGDFGSLSQYMVEVNILVSDGEDTPYYISSLEELKAIGTSGESVTKNYVLTKDIEIGSSSFAPIGNYYEVATTEENFNNKLEPYYKKVNGDFEVAESFEEETQYYAYGFGGTFSGKYTIKNLAGEDTYQYYGLVDINCSGQSDRNQEGIFAQVGASGKISDLYLSFGNSEITLASSAVAGGLVAVNYGRIERVSLKVTKYYVTNSRDLTFGAIVGENYGVVDLTNATTTTGNITINSNKENAQLFIGGFVGKNFGDIVGSSGANTSNTISFDDLGFDCNISLTVSGSQSTNSNIGIVAGYSCGTISNFAVSGLVDASNFYNVGGLVGKIEYKDDFSNEQYSIKDSYTIARVIGGTYVGGAIGYVVGTGGKQVRISGISAENYDTQSFSNRVFVKGTQYVGGLIGAGENLEITYSYVESFYNLAIEGYDIEGSNVGGFIGLAQNISFSQCASYINVKRIGGNAGLFGVNCSSVTINNSFACGYNYNANKTSFAKTLVGSSEDYSNNYILLKEYNEASKTFSTYINGSTSKSISVSGSCWKKSEEGSDIPYYLVLADGKTPLMAVPPTISSSVRNADNYDQFVDATADLTSGGDDSVAVVLFLAQDTSGLCTSEQLERLNTIDILDMLNINIDPQTYKTSKISVSTTKPTDVLTVKDGKIILYKEGKTTLKIASKLSTLKSCTVEVLVMKGASDVRLYSNDSALNDLNGGDITMIKNSSKTLYTNANYDRKIDGKTLSFGASTSSINMRFMISKEQIETNATLRKYENSLFNVLSFAGLGWENNNALGYQYVDVEESQSITLLTKLALEDKITISYVPFIRETIGDRYREILLDKLKGCFTLEIINGASSIMLENNIDSDITMNQLEKFSLTVIAQTDDINDTIEIYTDPLIANNDTALKFLKVKSEEKSTEGQVAYKFTFWYANKLEPLSKNLVYNIQFYAESNPTSVKKITLTIVPQKNLKTVSANIYSELEKDFPQSPSQSNVIYNGRLALLTLEVYPYLADYSTLKLRYLSSSTSSLTITQLYYDANKSGSSDVFSINSSYGAEHDSTGALYVKKESAQDVFLSNENGVYSYSRFMFFSLLIPSDTPNKSIYYLYVDVMDSKGNIILTQPVVITTLSKTIVELSFDEKFKGQDGLYYLPVNTTQKINVVTSNDYKTTTWVVSAKEGTTLTQAQKDVFVPYKVNGSFYIDLMNYAENKFTTDLIGKTIMLELTLDDGSVSDKKYISFVLTPFTVTNITASQVLDGYMTVKNSTTTPLHVDVEAIYDESATTSSNNWYAEWYNNYITSDNPTSDSFYQLLINNGYTIKQNFADYISLLQEKITKAKYNSRSTSDVLASGVWLYRNEEGTLTALKSGETYNNGTFGVEEYNGYVAIFGYEEDYNSTLSLLVRLSYSNKVGDITYKGIPNVEGYNYDSSIYSSMFTFSQDFVLKFVSATSFFNPIPVSNEKEFLELSGEEDGDYRLTSDIILSNYTPFEAKIDSFDGNNYKIFITSFADNSSTLSSLGLFTSISQNTMVCNVTVVYTNQVEYDSRTLSYVATQTSLNMNVSNYSSVNFGGLCDKNYGTITNCKVTGAVYIYSTTSKTSNTMGGLVASNESSGYITNSKVSEFGLSTCGQIGGFVGRNSGTIVSSYFDSSNIEGLMSGCNIGGFVYSNGGTIAECYVQGAKASGDTVRYTGSEIISINAGNIGAFAYTNSSIINDSYANIPASTASNKAGFVYVDTNSSEINRCYSIFYKGANDNTTAIYPFVGPYNNTQRVVVNGTLNNCYYLTENKTGYWATDSFYTSATSSELANKTPDNKKAVGLKVEDFATHDNFTNYDISLNPETGIFAGKTYYYVDGYTWAIIGGKPLIVSTLTDTVSMQEYQGKQKFYTANDKTLFEINEETEFYQETSIVGLDGSLQLTKYYLKNDSGSYSDEDLVYTALENSSTSQTTYEYFLNDGVTLSIVSRQEDGEEKFVSAEYGADTKQILDVKTFINDTYTDTDENFRANDTVVLEFDEEGNIKKIVLKELQSVSYLYSEKVANVSDFKGTRTNPYLLYDYGSFTELLSEDTDGKFYRLVRDIDLAKAFVKTSSKTFRGIFQGNHMTLSNLAMSYYGKDETVESTEYDANAFGLFAKIATTSNAYSQDTVISNLDIIVKEVASNSHKYVGALAGQLLGESSSKKIFLNNINIIGTDDCYLAGKNAVGGLAGYATGNVIIKDITSSASVNATYNAISDKSKMLYINESLMDKVSYAGGIVGIFDVTEVQDTSTLKNYNANNITIASSVYYQGNVVGGVFGLVGTKAIVNYANISYDIQNGTYVKAIAYAGGLVGENRGRIVSSSVNYKDDSDMISQIRPNEDSSDNIFLETSNNTLLGVGGLVGLNNGGIISNSISTINVRNKTATVVGGAVGRMVGGGLVNVVATGAVLGSKIVGGLVGTINDKAIITTENAGYNSLAFIDFTSEQKRKEFNTRSASVGGISLNAGETTFISSCIAGNNYLSTDYSSLDKLITSTQNVFAGFIGLIAFYSETNAISSNCKNSIRYVNKSYFVDMLYKSSSEFKYLNSTYYSPVFDGVYNKSSRTNILTNVDGQAVYPYSVENFYYEAQRSGISYSITKKTNTQDGIQTSVSGSDVMPYIYEFASCTLPSIKNSKELYTFIDSSDSGRWTSAYKDREYEWYKARFGVFYYKEIDGNIVTTATTNDDVDGTYVEVTEDMVENWDKFRAQTVDGKECYTKFYYLSNSCVTHVDYSTKYTYDSCNLEFTGGEGGNLNGYTFYNYVDILNQKYVLINGIQIPLTNVQTITQNPEVVDDTNGFVSGEYSATPNLLLPNGSLITKLVFNVEKYIEDNVNYCRISDVTVTYSVKNITTDSSQSIYLKSSSTSNLDETKYELKTLSKGVIYKSFNNGYWAMDSNFYAESFASATKYPTNLEVAEVYLWSRFASSSNDVEPVENVVTIRKAEELAKVADIVNSGTNDYNGITIELISNIDLSGKYWIPIGTEAHPFKGTFEGNGYSIQYVSVNQTSGRAIYKSDKTLEYSSTSKYIDHVGLFGYVQNATIKNLNILGGEVVGKYAGGLVGYAINSTIENISNKNSAVGLSTSGGIVGYMKGGSLSKCTNNASVSLMEENYLDLYVGGLIGEANGVTISGDKDNISTNSGKISATSNYTNYVASNRLVNLYVGGAIGKATATKINFVQNDGDIEVKTNANKVFVGGVIGDSHIEGETDYSIYNLKNNGQIFVENGNIFQEDKGSLNDRLLDEFSTQYTYATFDVGGVIGRADSSLKILSNLATIRYDVLSPTSSHTSLGGVVGRLKNDNNKAITLEQSYNSGNVASTATTSSSFGIGGVVGVIDLNSDTSRTVSAIEIRDNYNSALITSNSAGNVFMGGIVGYVYNRKSVTLANCVKIKNNLNVGYATIYDILTSKNALGAIIGYNKYCHITNLDGDYGNDDVTKRVSYDLNNYYLAGNTYSGSSIYAGYCTLTGEGLYKSESDVFDDNFYKGETDKYFFAKELSSTNLKQKSSYEMRKKRNTETTTYVLDFENVWTLKYLGTWYPTLKNNENTSYWIDNASEIITASSTYFVSTAEELSFLAKKINSGELDSKGITIKLAKSIDLANKYFTPIGTSTNPFEGTFDGCNYEIKNLTIDGLTKYINSAGTESFDDTYGGLFGVVKNATIKNVGLESPIIRDVCYAGGVVAYATNSSLVSLYTDCSQASVISAPSVISGSISAGGIVGTLKDSKDKGSAKKGLYNSYNNVYVQAGANDTYRTGGLVGEVSSSNVFNCYNNYYGTVTVTDASRYPGGVVIGKIDADSEILNIFNLSSTLFSRKDSSSGSGTTLSPAFYIKSSENSITQGTLTLEYANLKEDSDNPIGDIWTKEYSLNPASANTYPSLRGLNREWKNSPSEAIVGFAYSSEGKTAKKEAVYSYIDSIKNIYKDGAVVSGKIDYSLANFANDSFYEAKVTKVYLITCEEDLVWVANNVNNGVLTTSGVEFMLVADLDLSGRYFTPIGKSRTYSFNGVFNFNGHVIRGLTIDSNYTYSGLFGYTQNAFIINGYLLDSFIKIDADDTEARAYAGGVVGFAENTTIKNIVVSSCMSISSRNGSYVGGVVGYYSRSSLSSSIENVRVSGAISTNVDASAFVEKNSTTNMITGSGISGGIDIVGYSVDGGAYVGGVAGYAIVTVDSSDVSKINDTIRYATVDATIAGVSTSTLTTAHVGVGGILGYGADLVIVEACRVVVTSKIKAYSNRFDSVGGIAGYLNNGVIKNCQFDGYVEPRATVGRDATSNQIWSYVGGIVGICTGGEVSSCYSSGKTLTNRTNQDVSAGIIIGLARYRSFKNDKISVYDNNSTSGFTSGDSTVTVGQIENSDGTNTPDKDLASIYKMGVGEITTDNGFNASYWTSGAVISKKIFVIGGGKYSFKAIIGEGETSDKDLNAEGSADSPAGLMIDSFSSLKLKGETSTSEKIGIVYVKKDGNNLVYIYKETNLTDADSLEINVSKYATDIGNDDVIVVFITKITE